MITQMETSLLIRLIIAHLIADFVFQSDSWVKQRFNNGWSSKYLYFHGLIAGFLAYLFCGLWSFIWILAVVAITHILIDGMKVKYTDNVRSFLIDQAGHFLVIFGVWLWIINPESEDINFLTQVLLPGLKIWVIIGAYIVIIWPCSVLISKITEKWRLKISSDESLENAGRWIGILERFLILTFVLLQQYSAIGLLVAAKSIFRFSEIRKVGEYVLIGTLLSFTVAIIVGLIAGWFFI